MDKFILREKVGDTQQIVLLEIELIDHLTVYK